MPFPENFRLNSLTGLRTSWRHDGERKPRVLVTRAGSRAKIVMLTMHRSDEHLAAALRRGDVAIAATEATRAGGAERLIATGCDVAHAAERGTYISLHARVAVAQVMEGGRLDASRLAVIVNDLERSRLAGSASRLTIVGAGAPDLSGRPSRDGAARRTRVGQPDPRASVPHGVFYSMDCFRETDPDVFSGICAPHSAVCHAHDV
jgi:hypothetical protein